MDLVRASKSVVLSLAGDELARKHLSVLDLNLRYRVLSIYLNGISWGGFWLGNGWQGPALTLLFVVLTVCFIE